MTSFHRINIIYKASFAKQVPKQNKPLNNINKLLNLTGRVEITEILSVPKLDPVLKAIAHTFEGKF